MENEKYDMTNMKEVARHTFYTHLGVVQYEVWLNERMSKQEIIRQMDLKAKKELRDKKIYKLPLIGKMIYNNKVHSYSRSTRMYKLMLSLMEKVNFDYLDDAVMELIMQNKDELYDAYYKNYYERQFCKNELTERIKK